MLGKTIMRQLIEAMDDKHSRIERVVDEEGNYRFMGIRVYEVPGDENNIQVGSFWVAT